MRTTELLSLAFFAVQDFVKANRRTFVKGVSRTDGLTLAKVEASTTVLNVSFSSVVAGSNNRRTLRCREDGRDRTKNQERDKKREINLHHEDLF